MNITEPFVLKDDVLLIPCADLSDDVRGRISFEEGDFTLSRRHGRVLSQVIDRGTAALLSLFREPRTIVEAVVENSRVLGRNPDVRLDELLPHLGVFLHNHVLVPAGSGDEKEIRPQYESGAPFGDWQIVRCASLIEDSEVYQLRNGSDVAALKIARLDTPDLRELFLNEIAILRHLDGSGVAPRLLEYGILDGRPYVVMQWAAGIEAIVASKQRRHDRSSLIELCAAIAAAYATLHAHGVVHGDVHPRNVLAGDEVVLIDFGFARFIDQPSRVGRGGMYSFYEPEYFAADAPASPAGDQYSMAAMLYELIAGKPYLEFRYDREEMARQVELDPPIPFAERGIPPWPEVEEILFRALEKDPSRRFDSMREMADRLAAARDTTVRQSLATPVSEEATALLEATLRSFARGGAMFVSRYAKAPTASINYGCAGAAVGLLRIAEARDDPALLALADVWRSRAVTLIASEDAYYDADDELPRDLLGDITPYHTESGIHAAQAMIAAAMGNVFAQRRAVDAFLRASSRPCEQLDLTLGRSGSLLAAALLLAISDDPAESAPLRSFGAETMSAIWSALDDRPITDVGMAHGWTGYLYAALRWCAASGDALPPMVVERIHQLTAREQPSASWCSGSAGQVFLFTLAHRLLGDAEWLQLAELAAWNTWDAPCDATTLCCGTAGRAYALLNLYKHTGAAEWLSRARQMANHAAANATNGERTNALWKGELGIAVLIADLASPENARMPFFE